LTSDASGFLYKEFNNVIGLNKEIQVIHTKTMMLF